MLKVLKHIPRVMVIQETSVQPGRDKLQGIFNYAHLYGPWNIHLVHGRSGEQRPKTVNDLRGYDGIIVGQMMLELAKALGGARRPTVLMDPLDEALQPNSPFARLSCTLDDSEQVGKAAAEYFLGRGFTASRTSATRSTAIGRSAAARASVAGSQRRAIPAPPILLHAGQPPAPMTAMCLPNGYWACPNPSLCWRPWTPAPVK